MRVRPIELLEGDVIEDGVVSHVTSKRKSTWTTVFFIDGTQKTYGFKDTVEFVSAS